MYMLKLILIITWLHLACLLWESLASSDVPFS